MRKRALELWRFQKPGLVSLGHEVLMYLCRRLGVHMGDEADRPGAGSMALDSWHETATFLLYEHFNGSGQSLSECLSHQFSGSRIPPRSWAWVSQQIGFQSQAVPGVFSRKDSGFFRSQTAGKPQLASVNGGLIHQKVLCMTIGKTAEQI